MTGRPLANRSAVQRLEIVLEGLKGGNIAETCRRYQIVANLYSLGRKGLEIETQETSWGSR